MSHAPGISFPQGDSYQASPLAPQQQRAELSSGPADVRSGRASRPDSHRLDSLGVLTAIDSSLDPPQEYSPGCLNDGFASSHQRSMPKEYRNPSNVPMYTRPFAMEMPPQWFQLAIWSPLDQRVFPVRASNA